MFEMLPPLRPRMFSIASDVEVGVTLAFLPILLPTPQVDLH